jgi:ADP-heptose:LPS heptosyltransferase
LVFKKIPSSKTVESWKDPKPAKRACVVRYGAFGDLIQASSVFAGLKEQGFHVTLFASPPGSDVIMHDPNVDKIILFDKDQVPNGNLHDFWSWQSKNYDRFVNLSESVEGTFLALPGRIQHVWDPLTRHKRMNFNYLEHQHDVAQVPHKPQVKFYATDEEKAWARLTRSRMGKGPIIMYSLSGSSVHKTWQGMDTIIASIMLHFPTSTVVLVGGPEAVILEQGWEKESRVVRTCGKWTIRQTMSFIAQCDLMIGPETGVMNAAACEKIPKVVFLSHSSHENLTRDWALAYPMWARTSECPMRPEGVSACHVLHYGWDHCMKNPTTHTAQCQAEITPEQVWGCVAMLLERAVNKEAA